MNGDDNSLQGRQGLLVGAARVVITPPVGCEMSGFIARTKPMQGIHDDLYARALVCSNGTPASRAVFLTLDVIGVDLPVVEAIRRHVAELTGIAAERVAVTAIHTHGGPAVMEDRLLGRVDHAYLQFLIQATAGAAKAAANSLCPTTARFGLGHEGTVGKNRRVAGGLIDPDVPVLRFDGPDGRVQALLVSYACHPVTLGANNLLATADYPGYLVHTLEALYPEAHIQFATGCCGQINTGHTAYDSVSGRGTERRTYAECARLGRALAGAAMQAAEQVAPPGGTPLAIVPDTSKPARVQVLRRNVVLPLLPVQSPCALHEQAAAWRKEAEHIERHGGPTGDLLQLRGWADWAERAASDPQSSHGTVTSEVMVLALDEVCLVLLPGEPFVELGLEIKQRADRQAIMVLGYANSSPGYIPHRSAYKSGGYEVTEAYRFYGYPAGFAPEAGELLVSEALDLLSQVSRREC